MASGSSSVLPVTYPETYSDGLQLLIQATSSALSDKGFDLPTETAQKARLCAEKFLDWAKLRQVFCHHSATFPKTMLLTSQESYISHTERTYVGKIL